MILQDHIPYDLTAPALPGVRPFDPADWITVDEAYSGQMALRRDLLAKRRDDVLAMAPEAREAAVELLETVVAALPCGFETKEKAVLCPDGVEVTLDRGDPMGTLGRIVQEDLCLLQKHSAEHVLKAAVLCFPASWRLDEKFLRPMTGIHEPVQSYDDNLARRVQRLFDGVQVGRPLWRFNALAYDDPALFQPRSVHSQRPPVAPEQAMFLRSERQCLVRLPLTRAMVFSIHTYVVRRDPPISAGSD